MRYSDYRDFRKRLDAKTIHTISWVEDASYMRPSGNQWGCAEVSCQVKTIVASMALHNATEQEANMVYVRFEDDIRDALGAGLFDRIEGSKSAYGIDFEYAREEDA